MRRWARVLLAVTGVLVATQPVLATAGSDEPTPTAPTSTAEPAVADVSPPSAAVPAPDEQPEPSEPPASPETSVPESVDGQLPAHTEVATADSTADPGFDAPESPSSSVPADSTPADMVPPDLATMAESGGGSVGTLDAPGIIFHPESVDFGEVPVGTTGARVEVYVLWLDPALLDVPFRAVTHDGMRSSAYKECGPDACSLDVWFEPERAGAHEPRLELYHDIDGTLLATLSATGVGVGGSLAAAPTSVEFGSTTAGTASPVETVTITNTGNVPVDIVSADVEGPFTLEPATDLRCAASVGSPLAPSASCDLSVRFQPSSAGAHSGHLEVAGASGETVRVELAGTAAPAVPPVSISPSSHDFGTVEVGSTATHRFTVRNETAQTQGVNGLGTAQPFQATGNNCLDVPLAAGAECWIDVTFAPVAAGVRTETVSVNVDGFGAVTFGVSGTGQAAPTSPVLVVDPTSIDFGTVPVGTTSGPLTVTLTNTGTAPASLMSIFPIGSFDVTPNCFSLAAGSSCELTVTFTPTYAGPHPGEIVVSDAGSGASVTFLASGTGAAPDPVLSLSPSFYDFGDVAVGDASAPQSVTLTNSGGPAMFLSFLPYGPFDVDHSACSSLPAGASCVVTVTFRPTGSGYAWGSLTVTDLMSGFAFASFAGMGVDDAPVPLTVTPGDHDFGDVEVGDESAAQVFTFANPGDVSVSLSGLDVSGPFAVDDHNCSGTLGAGETCTASVVFAPSEPGAGSGQLTLRYDGGSTTAQLHGDGVEAPVPPLSVSPVAVDFGLVTVGHGVTETVTVTNRAGSAVPVSVGDVSSPFGRSTSCGAVLDAGASCSVTVSFTPVGDGVAGSSLTVRTPVDGSVQSVDVAVGGTGVVADVAVSDVDFGDVGVGESGSATATVRNDGDAAVTISTVATSAPFAVVDEMPCVTVLEPGAECRVDVTFTPTDRGDASATLTVTHPAGTSTGSLTGHALALVTVTPSIDFGTHPVNVYTRRELVITNDSDEVVTVTPPVLPGEVAVGDDACWNDPIPAGESCTVTLVYDRTVIEELDIELVIETSVGPLSTTLRGRATEDRSHPIAFDPVTVGHEGISGSRVASIYEWGVDLSGLVPPFYVVEGCGAPSQPFECTFTIAFRPEEVGEATGIIVVQRHEGNFRRWRVVATGVPAVVAVSDVHVGDVGVGETGTGTATVRNDGEGALTITGVTTSAPFAVSDETPCVTTLEPGAECSVDVTFTPTGRGDASGTLTVTHLAGTSTATVSGRGIEASLDADQSLDFGAVLAGGTRELPVTFTNSGNVDLTLDQPATTGPFEAIDGCTGPLGAGATCTATVRYAPDTDAAGEQSGTLSLGGTADGIEAVASVDLQGFAAVMALQVDPTQHDFGTVALGRYVPSWSTTVTNAGNVPVTVTLDLPGGSGFAVGATDCDEPLDAGGSCRVTLSYQPSDAAAHTATLSVTGSADLATGTHDVGADVELTGAAAAVSISADGPLEFGDVEAGEQSGPLTLTLTNDGPEVGVSGVSVPDGFVVVDDGCTGATLATGETCTVSVAVAAAADGEIDGDVIVTLDTDDALDVAVSAVSAAAVSGSLTILPGDVEFANVVIGEAGEQQLTITNSLNVPTELTDLTLGTPTAGTGAAGYSRPGGLRAALAQAAAIDGPFRLDAADCTDRVLEPGESCTVTLRFVPTAPGSAAAVLSVVSTRASAEIAVTGSAIAAPPAPPTSGPADDGAPGTTPEDDGGPGDGGPDGSLPATGATTVLVTVVVAIALMTAGIALVTVRKRAG